MKYKNICDYIYEIDHSYLSCVPVYPEIHKMNMRNNNCHPLKESQVRSS